MEKTKSTIPRLSFYDRTGIQEYLEDMAQKGWLLTEIRSLFWDFRQIEPKKIHYAVTYFPKNTFLDSKPSEELIIFREFCEHAGWILAGTSAQMQVFYNENDDPTPIETDAEEELRKINKTALKSWLPLKVLELYLFSRILKSNIGLMLASPLRVLSVPVALLSTMLFSTFTIVEALDILSYLAWYLKAKRAIKTNGSFTPTKSLSTLKKIISAAAVIVLIVSLMFSSKNIWITGIGTVVIALILLSLLSGSVDTLKSLQLSRGFNAMGYISLFFICIIVMVYFSVLLILSGSKSTTNLYEYEGRTYGIYEDELPLYVQDMIDLEYDGFSCMSVGSESMLISYYELSQEPRVYDTHIPEMEYTITEVKFSPLYDWLTVKAMETKETDTAKYREMDALPWGADKAYRLYEAETPTNTYLVCWDKHIAEISTSWEMTSEQMQIAAMKLTSAD